MENARGLDFNEHFGGFWTLQVQFFNRERRADFSGDRSLGFHCVVLCKKDDTTVSEGAAEGLARLSGCSTSAKNCISS
jgi:hypothetical protein